MTQLKDVFLLDPEVHYLNFGAFGACPKPIFEKYQSLQLQLEKQPTEFITKTGPALLNQSKTSLASYINCQPEDLIYITNPTFGVNVIANSLQLQPGDEVLSTNLEYGACDRTWEYYSSVKGIKYIKQNIELPIQSKEHFIESFWRGYSENTKVIFLSQITSMTALSLPVKEICEEARKRGLIIIVDGAHVPGQLDVDLSALDCDVYLGACHKWMLTPKGSSFMVVSKTLQEKVLPLVVSWGYQAIQSLGSTYLDYHTFIGTRDFTAFLTIPAAIEFMEEYEWTKVRSLCAETSRQYLTEICNWLGNEPIAPVNGDFILQMGSIPVACADPAMAKNILLQKYKLELPVFSQNGRQYIRFSYNGFNTLEDLEVLSVAIKNLKAEGVIS